MELVPCVEGDPIAEWLSVDPWPFHGGGPPPPWFGPEIRSFWILEDGGRAGLARAFDLGDPTPLFDLRIRAVRRRRGLGRAALRALTDFVFRTFPDPPRFGGYTRADNHAMRRVFEACGFTLEALHRRAWPSVEGWIDAAGYAILREEWERGILRG